MPKPKTRLLRKVIVMHMDNLINDTCILIVIKVRLGYFLTETTMDTCKRV